MKQVIRVYLVLLGLSLSSLLMAKQIPLGEAQKIVLILQEENLNTRNEADIKLVKTKRGSQAGRSEVNLYYVFNVGESQGFAIIAADDVCTPVIGYSTEGKYDENELPDNFKEWMFSVEEGINLAIARGDMATPEISEMWQVYSSGTKRNLRTITAIDPLVTTKWSQWSPYDDLAPFVPVGEADKEARAPSGCVATAMAQIMAYHKFPNKGIKAIEGYTTRSLKIEMPSLDITTYTYDWDKMSDIYNSSSSAESKQAVADLVYHCGLSVEMDYQYAGSGAYSSDVVKVLPAYWGYDSNATYESRSRYPDKEDWVDLVLSQLDEKLPVYYSGRGTGGHAFICDGVDENGLFHFNWGWGGYQDGYYSIDAPLSYTDSHALIANLKPAKEIYKKYHKTDCEGLRKFLSQTGTDEDGNLVKNYESVGLTDADIQTWENSEEWVDKITGLIWSPDLDGKRIRSIAWIRYKKTPLVGVFDGTYFPELLSLKLPYSRITALDLSKNPSLTNLDCRSNQITALDLGENTGLINLDCRSNQITALDLSKNTNLKILDCRFNLIAELNISGSAGLMNLDCSNNQIVALNLSENTNLEILDCSVNQITALDLSKNASLEFLNCSNNQITALDLRENANLVSLFCSNNQITALDLSKSVASLYCYDNKIDSLDLTENADLGILDCSINQISELDLSKNTKLTVLYCTRNQITALDLSKNTDLRQLDCRSNQITAVDVLKNISLEYLDCRYNQITELDLSESTSLTTLYCYDNQISELNLSNNANLAELLCQRNYLLFSKLPLLNATNRYEYAPQNTITSKAIPANTTIDLSEEYDIDGTITTFSWYDSTDKPIELISAGNGKYIADVKYVGTDLTCKMTNQRFPDLTIEYVVPIQEAAVIQGNYHEDDKAGLRSFLEQSEGGVKNYQTAGLTEADKAEWSTSEDWIVKLKGVTWDKSEKKRIVSINWDNSSNASKFIGVLDCRGFAILTDLRCSGNNIESLDVTQNSQLVSLFCSSNKLTVLDVTSNGLLSVLFADFNDVGNLDLSNNYNLTRLSVDNNRLEELDITANDNLTYLRCQGNNLRFSTLPSAGSLAVYAYSSQAVIDGGSVIFGQVIDLRQEWGIGGNPTSYKWYDDKGKRVSLSDRGDGVFIIDNIQSEFYLCKMTNRSFPDLRLEYKVETSGAFSMDAGLLAPISPYLSDHNLYIKGLSEDVKVKLVTLSSGFKVLDTILVANNPQAYVGNLAVGIYVLHVERENGTVETFKLMKQ